MARKLRKDAQQHVAREGQVRTTGRDGLSAHGDGPYYLSTQRTRGAGQHAENAGPLRWGQCSWLLNEWSSNSVSGAGKGAKSSHELTAHHAVTALVTAARCLSTGDGQTRCPRSGMSPSPEGKGKPGTRGDIEEPELCPLSLEGPACAHSLLSLVETWVTAGGEALPHWDSPLGCAAREGVSRAPPAPPTPADSSPEDGSRAPRAALPRTSASGSAAAAVPTHCTADTRSSEKSGVLPKATQLSREELAPEPDLGCAGSSPPAEG
ncbi:uncharacterized protein LOC125616854 isoform X2 [Marmota marmota marmota]|uniref:uncharacterized protein LOC125616854 isoform X2 n=1 Tax=Marmota marmota marmota TaxID=9994 RepID=UPI0020938394|nr:uncharacterized protein LOC125616854 isoform X2 [Marmota marmota marmota]